MKKILIGLMAVVAVVIFTGCEGDSGDTYNVTAGGDAHIGDVTTTYTAEDVDGGIYRDDYSKDSCEEAGFYYCDIESQCLDIPLEGGSCNG